MSDPVSSVPEIAEAEPAPPTSIDPMPGSGTDPSGGGEPQSGLLTAGSFDDNLNFGEFQEFLNEVRQGDTSGVYPAFAVGQRIIVRVLSAENAPVFDARVVIKPAGGNEPVLDQRTGADGRVLLFTGVDVTGGANAPASFSVTVTPPDGAAPVVATFEATNPDWDVTLAVAATPPQQLDLAFLVDTTGSMTDELEYLKLEVRGIAQAVAELFPDVDQRYALVVYRDDGDIYVTKSYEFTASLDEFVGQLGEESAGGGGDRPEAVHLALEAVAPLEWREAGAAHVLFWIADAPPHTEYGARSLAAMRVLREKAVSIYPIAASGVETDLEYYMRIAALLTRSEYIFLTDDSGVGNAHSEPHIPCYHVQRLDQVVLRMIRTALSGERVEPEPATIIRTVGNPVAGVCTEAGQ
ncbi:MAG: vWA domain-containing protein [Planctomycetota bacterium]